MGVVEWLVMVLVVVVEVQKSIDPRFCSTQRVRSVTNTISQGISGVFAQGVVNLGFTYFFNHKNVAGRAAATTANVPVYLYDKFQEKMIKAAKTASTTRACMHFGRRLRRLVPIRLVRFGYSGGGFTLAPTYLCLHQGLGCGRHAQS